MQHLLFLVHRIPFPPTKGDKVRSYNLLRYLCGRYRVHLGAFVDDDADFAHAGTLRAMCEDCHLLRLDRSLAKAKSVAGLFSGGPLTVPYYASPAMHRWVRGVLRDAPVRAALVFSAAMAQYVMKAHALHRVADLVDVDSDKWQQYAATQPWPRSAIYRRESRVLLHYEREIARRFDATVFVSAAEAELFRRHAPESAQKVWHVDNGVDSDYFSPSIPHDNPYQTDAPALVFTGAMDYWPNVDAVVWFAREIFPRIRAQAPDAGFYIVGSRPAPEVVQLGDMPGVTVTGAVPDIRPYLAHAKLAVAPLRMARGVQNKVLEAMAMAKTVLASPQAAEGIDAEIGAELLVAADEQEFVQRACMLLELDGAPAVGAAGRKRVLASYSWDSSLSRFEHLLSNDAAPGLQYPHAASQGPRRAVPPSRMPL